MLSPLPDVWTSVLGRTARARGSLPGRGVRGEGLNRAGRARGRLRKPIPTVASGLYARAVLPAPSAIAERLRPFVERGLLRNVPNRVQIRQAELGMLAYVLSSDATDERRYEGRVLGHPLVRQPVIFAHVGLDHLDPGCSLGASHASIVTHLLFTYHRGTPVFDLQLLQTHPDGLDRARASIVRHLGAADPATARRRRFISAILNDPDEYHRRFLGPTGFLARAAAFEYPTPADEGSPFPPEYFSLVAFLEHAATFPRRPRELGVIGLGTHLARLATRRHLDQVRMRAPSARTR